MSGQQRHQASSTKFPGVSFPGICISHLAFWNSAKVKSHRRTTRALIVGHCLCCSVFFCMFSLLRCFKINPNQLANFPFLCMWYPHWITLTNLLEAVQNKAARFILSSYPQFQSVLSLKETLDMLPLTMLSKFPKLSFFLHALSQQHIICPVAYFTGIAYSELHWSCLHNQTYLLARREKSKNSPLTLSVKEWNDLASEIATITVFIVSFSVAKLSGILTLSVTNLLS